MRGWWFAVIVAMSLCIPFVHGLAVSYDYLDHDTLSLQPGETYYYRLVLQNEDDTPINITVAVESPIATLIGPSALALPPKTFSATVYLNITVPMNTTANTSLPVRFIVAPAPTTTDGGQVPFSVRYDRTVTVVVDANAPVRAPMEPIPIIPVFTEPQVPKGQPGLAATLIGLGVLLIIAIVLIARRVSRKPRS